MKILIDTTVSKLATITLLSEGQVIVSKTNADALSLVAEILKENNLTLAEVDFELLNEAGSYTGLKVGAALVNTLNFIKGKKKLVVPSYIRLAENLSLQAEDKSK